MIPTDPTARQLLAMVVDAPDDDGPRLVLADRLEEIGQSDRAELIRCQVSPTMWQGECPVCPSWTNGPENPWHGQPGYRPERDPASGRHEGGWTNCKTCNGGGPNYVKAGIARGEWAAGRCAELLLVRHGYKWCPELPDVCWCINGLTERKVGTGRIFGITFARGFPHTAHVPTLAAVVQGGRCDRCEGCGSVNGNNRPHEYTPERKSYKCQSCTGTGRVDALGPALLAACPTIQWVVCADRRPLEVFQSVWCWSRRDRGDDSHGIPSSVFRLLNGGTHDIVERIDYPTATLAAHALGTAVAQWAKGDVAGRGAGVV